MQELFGIGRGDDGIVLGKHDAAEVYLTREEARIVRDALSAWLNEPYILADLIDACSRGIPDRVVTAPPRMRPPGAESERPDEDIDKHRLPRP